MRLPCELNASSRFFLAPINTGFAENGVPTSRLIRFHQERSGHGIGISYVGNVAVAEQYRTNDGTAILFREDIAVWRDVARAIEERGSIPAIQLACRHSRIPSRRDWKCRDRSGFVTATSQFIDEISREEIADTCEKFVQSAAVAAEAGFRVVQIHAAHGYLLASLLNRVINRRTDEFRDGVSALAIIARGINALSADIILDIRVSLFDGLEDPDQERAYRALQIAEITRCGYKMVSLSAGMYDVDRRMIYPGQREGKRAYLPYATELAARYPLTIWNAAGNLGSIADLADHRAENLTFSIGRPLIADPEFVEKSLSGRAGEIIQCEFTGHCHYFSRGKMHIECGVNLSL